MLGKIFNTLSYRVKQEEREWRSKSDLRKEYAYGRIRGNLINLSRKPVKWTLFVLLFFCFLTFLITQLPVKWLVLETNEFDNSNLLSYFSILWSLQATIVALIYPIVIAFVTLLLQRRHSAKSYLNIYLHDTAALLSGLFAIGLIFLMALQYLFLTVVEINIALNWLLVDALFFLLNLSLTSYFLYQTFEYIKPASRIESLKKYLINFIWPEEFKSHLSSLLFSNSIKEKLLKVEGVERGIHNKNRPTIWTQRDLSSRLGKPIIEIELPKNSVLTDVRFRLLSFVAKKWSREAKKLKSKEPQNGYKENHVLIFPINTGIVYSGQTTLCKIEGDVKLSSFQKRLIRWSFKFKKKKTDNKLHVDDLLNDLRDEVLRSLRSGEAQVFSDALDDLVEFIAVLIKASAFRNADSFDNYSRIVDPNRSIFGRSVYEDWFKRINDIYEPAVGRITSDDSYISDLIYVPQRLFWSIKETAHTDILKELLVLSKYLNYRVSDWWLKTIENQGVTDHDKCNSATLLRPYHGTYENILRSFIGYWEGLKNRAFLPRKEDQDWSIFQTAFPLFELHLNITAELLLDSIYKGDKSRTKYFLDSLLKWLSGLHFNLDFSGPHLIDNSESISLDYLNLSWDEVKEDFDLEDLNFLNHEPSNLIFSNAIENYWIDVCCILLYNLSKDALSCNKLENSLIADSFKAIFYGEHPINTGSSFNTNKKTIKSADALFGAILRQFYSGFNSDQNYRKRIDNLIDKITPNLGFSMIPGRVYSGFGRNDLRVLRDGLLLMLTLLVQKKWDPTRKFKSHLKNWITNNLQQIENLVRDIEGAVDRLNDNDFDKYETIYNFFSKSNNRSFQDSREFSVKGLVVFKEKVETTHLELTKSLDIDRNKLIQIEKWVSEKPFDKNSGLFPIPLFERISTVENELENREYKFEGCKKGWFTEPIMALHGPDKQFYKDLLIGSVGYHIWSKAYSNLPIDEIKIASSQDYWEKIKEYEEILISEDKTPILIVNSSSDPKWLRDWLHLYGNKKESVPDDLDLRKRDDIKLRSYLGHFNKTEVHKVDTLQGIGTSILLAKESFKELQISINENENFISAIPQKKDNPTIIDIKFAWQFEVSVEPINALLLKH